MAEPALDPALAAPLSRLVREYLGPAVPGRTFRDAYRVASDLEARALGLVPVLEANPAYVQLLESLDMLRPRIAAWVEEEQGNPRRDSVILERTVSLLQKTATRNAIASLQILRSMVAAGGAGLPRKKSDRLALSPREQIPCALAAEDDCVNRSFPGSAQAYAAGYHYDVLKAIFTARKAPKDAKDAWERAWKEGFLAARIASVLVSSLKSFHHHKYVYASALLAPIGKPLMAVLFPKDLGEGSWSAFVASCDKLGERKHLAEWVGERRRFAVTHAEVSALVVSFMGFFGPVERAIACYPDPHRLQRQDREMYRLAGLVSVVTTLAVSGAKSGFSEVLNGIQLKCLKDLGFDLAQLDLIMGRALAQGASE